MLALLNKKDKKGFTLIELLVVIAIIGLVAAVAVPLITKNLQKGKDEYNESLKANLVQSAKNYYVDNPKQSPRRQIENGLIKVYDEISVSYLKTNNYFVNEVKDADGNDCSKYSRVKTYIDESGKSNYKVCLVCVDEKNNKYNYQTDEVCNFDEINDKYVFDLMTDNSNSCEITKVEGYRKESNNLFYVRGNDNINYTVECLYNTKKTTDIVASETNETKYFSSISDFSNPIIYGKPNSSGTAYKYSIKVNVKSDSSLNGTTGISLSELQSTDNLEKYKNNIAVVNSKPDCTFQGPFADENLTTKLDRVMKNQSSVVYYGLNCKTKYPNVLDDKPQEVSKDFGLGVSKLVYKKTISSSNIDKTYVYGATIGSGSDLKVKLPAGTILDIVGNKSNEVSSDLVKIISSKPVCVFTGPFIDKDLKTTTTASKKEQKIYYGLTCTDNDDEIIDELKKSSITSSDTTLLKDITVTNTTTTKNTKKYLIEATTGSGDGNAKLTLKEKALNNSGDGNEAKSSATLVVDNTNPSCKDASGVSTTWEKKDRNVTITCADSGSGCVKGSYTQKFTESAKTGKITIADKAGNTTDCSVNLYIDKTAPVCTCWLYYTNRVDCSCTDYGSGFGYSNRYGASNDEWNCHHVDRCDNTGDCATGHNCSSDDASDTLIIGGCRTISVHKCDKVGNCTDYSKYLCP